MRKRFAKILLPGFAVILLIFFNACKKETDKMIPPILEFKTGAGYISDTVTTVGISTAIKVGIHAEKTESGDYLNTFTVSHSFDGGSNMQDSTRILNESEHDNFDEDVNFTTRSDPEIEIYYFTITNRDGLIVTKTLSITVH